jgi:hypothetical protein
LVKCCFIRYLHYLLLLNFIFLRWNLLFNPIFILIDLFVALKSLFLNPFLLSLLHILLFIYFILISLIYLPTLLNCSLIIIYLISYFTPKPIRIIYVNSDNLLYLFISLFVIIIDVVMWFANFSNFNFTNFKNSGYCFIILSALNYNLFYLYYY